MLTGCGESQLSIGAQGAMPQSRATAAHADQGESWMMPEAASEDLLYASEQHGDMYVYSYAGRKLVGKVKQFADWAQGLCADTSGNVFVTSQNDDGGGTIYELAHGGTTPIAALSDSGLPTGCAVDPVTGNLAVANFSDASNPSESGDVAVYSGARGSPTIYTNPNMTDVELCTYDDAGNLFVDSRGDHVTVLAELPKNSSTFTDITINGFPSTQPRRAIQWDGQYITIAIPTGGKEWVVYRIQVSGSAAQRHSRASVRELSAQRGFREIRSWARCTVAGKLAIGRIQTAALLNLIRS